MSPSDLAPGGSTAGHPALTARERRGWLCYDFSNSAVVGVIVSGFLPLLVQDAAQAAAGFPWACGNLLANGSALAAYGTGLAPPAHALVLASAALAPSAACAGWPPLGPAAGAGPGAPASADACRAADGATRQALCARGAGGECWEPAAYTSAMNALATGLSMLAFVQVSALADHGAARKRLLTALSYAGAALCVACAAVRPGSWQLGGALIVATTVCYATTYVLYNAYLPLLAANDAAVLAAAPADRDAAFMRAMDALSSAGFAWGYVGGLLCLALCLAVTVAWQGDAIVAYGLNCALAGVWWALFSSFTVAWLRPRPGPPLPPGASVLTLPWRRLATACSRARELPQTFTFLSAWFVYSDGMNTIASVGAIYANTSVLWGSVDKSIGLAGMLLIPPLFALVGTVAFQAAAARRWLTPLAVINTCLVLMALVPAYGLLGFLSPTLGYVYYYELYAGVALYGFTVGALQAFSRSAFAAMIPEGQEDLFFSLYNVTDRGSSWVGPAVIAAILQSTGSIRAAFAYPLVCLLLPLALHARLDFARGEAAAKAYAVRHGTALRATRGAVSVVTDAAAAAAAAADTELVAVPPGINSTTTAGAAFAGAKPADGEDGSSLAGGRSLLHA